MINRAINEANQIGMPKKTFAYFTVIQLVWTFFERILYLIWQQIVRHV
jgi:hypothetical protein